MASIHAPSASAKPARASALATTSGQRKDAVPSFGVMWTMMRSIGDMSLPFFFSSVHVSNAHVVPSSNTPLIVCSNHSNTILDVAILASHFPERRPLHFWAKAGFFKNRITRFILTSSGNIKVDRRNKNNQALFEGTFEAMKAGGAIALFPEGGSYTIPKLASLKMGAAWAALEYSRYLQLQGEGKRTEVKILPSAVVFDDKSVFRSRAVLRFGTPISLDAYIEEFLSAPPPSEEATAEKKGTVNAVAKEDGTVPATPESMTRTNTSEGKEYASPAHRAVARLTADLQKAMESLTFNAPDWETFQAVRLARELTFELAPDGSQRVQEDMDEYVELSRAWMTLLTLDATSSALSVNEDVRRKSTQARQSLFAYSSLFHLANTENVTLARMSLQSSALSSFLSPLSSFLVRLPLYIPIFGATLVPTYLLPNALAHHFAGREEESLSSVKTLFSFFFTTLLYGGLLVKTMQWTKWSPPGLLVGLAGVWWLHDLGRSNIDTAYSLVKQVGLGWRIWRAGISPSALAAPPSSSADAASAVFKGWSRLPKTPNASGTRAGDQGKSLFFYGTLVHPKILARVIGNDGSHLTVQNAVLDGAKLYHVKGEEYPGLIRMPSSAGQVNAVKGTLVRGLTSADLACLDAFEGDEYERVPIRVIPDPACAAEANSTRIANVGSAPLHAILATLTKARIEELCTQRKQADEVDAEVYGWIAGEAKLEKNVWEFDVFARTHAQNWVGEGEVEHEHEYQLVDRVRTDLTSTATLTTTPPTVLTTVKPTTAAKEEGGESWIESYASNLAPEGPTREAVVRACKQLLVKPSIQFYVDKAFPRTEGLRRPKLGDKALLGALFRARAIARDALKGLLSAAQSIDDGDVQAAVGLLAGAKARAMSRHGVHLERNSSWPFTPAQAQMATSRDETRKSV